MKYQESFRAKTLYLHMWKYHLCYGFTINFTFQTKKLFQVAWRYEISLLVLKKYFTCSLRSLVTYFSTLEEKFRIPALPCNILYINNKKTKQKNQQSETKIKQTNKQTKNHARELPRNQSIRFDVILQQDCPIEQCLLQIIGFLWPENEESMFWSFHPLADKTNNEHLPKTCFKVTKTRSSNSNNKLNNLIWTKIYTLSYPFLTRLIFANFFSFI